MPTERPDSPPTEVPRGPQPTRQPSRLAMVVVGIGVAIVMGLLVVAGGQAPDRILDEGEVLVEEGVHVVGVGPVAVTGDLTGGDWLERDRCDRWVQLSDAENDGSTLHLVWMDAVPEPSTVGDVHMVAPPADLATHWREVLGLELVEVARPTVGPYKGVRYRLGATEASRREDGLVACGELDGIAATGLLGPAARFRQEVVVVDVDGTDLLLIAAAYTGGDLDRVVSALDDLVASAEVELVGDARPSAG